MEQRLKLKRAVGGLIPNVLFLVFIAGILCPWILIHAVGVWLWLASIVGLLVWLTLKEGA